MEISTEEFFKELESLYEKLDRVFNYKVVDKDPLESIEPTTLITLYSVNNGLGTYSFKTVEERDEWLYKNKPNFYDLFTLEYLGSVAGRDNVIRERNDNYTKLIAICDNHSYDLYDFNESKKRGTFVWKHYSDEFCDKYSELTSIKNEMKSKVKVK